MTHSPADNTAPRFHGFMRLVADVAACIRFFSRVPLPRLGQADDPARLPDFKQISHAIPLAGFVIALPAVVLGFLLAGTALPTAVIALLMIALQLGLTGALHEDGLADVADGFFGGHTAERRLEIMKDSQIGSFGALALIISIALRALLIGTLFERLGAPQALLALLGAESLSRMLMVYHWSALPPARPDGLGARFGSPLPTSIRHTILVTLACLAPALFWLPLTASLCGLLVALVSGYACARLACHKIGGFTGDVLGFIQQVTSIAFLLGITCMT